VQTAGDAQSATAAQAALHAETPQRKGKQVVAPGVTQAPAPSHVERGVEVVPEAGQLGSPQETPSVYFWHAPASHMPFVPQVDGACGRQVPAGSGAPAGTSRQRPIAPDSAHERQALEHAVAQQTPCAQTPEAHSTLVEQNAPVIFRPHEWLASHTLGATHASLAVQASKQRGPLHANGAHASDGGARQRPVLLHVAGGV
jgi:hypothetical protein